MGIRYNVNETFFESWSHPMAYLLGFLYADGSLEYSPKIRGKYIRVSSTDYHLINTVKIILDSKHTILKIQKISEKHKDNWLLRIGNSYLFDSLTKHGLEPKKSLTMSLPKIPSKYLGSFTRGYFDGDGCVHIERKTNKKGNTKPKRLRTIFTSGSVRFLSKLHNRLATINPALQLGNIYNSSRAYRLVYSTSASIALYVLMYKDSSKDLLLKRKFDRFNRYFSERQNKVSVDVRKIITKSAQW